MKNILISLMFVLMFMMGSCGEEEKSIYENYPDNKNTVNDTEQADNENHQDDLQNDSETADNNTDGDVIEELPTKFSVKTSPIYFLSEGKIFKNNDGNNEVFVEDEKNIISYDNYGTNFVVVDKDIAFFSVFSNGDLVPYTGERIDSIEKFKIINKGSEKFVKNVKGLYFLNKSREISKIVDETINNLSVCKDNPIWDNNGKIFTYDLETEEQSELQDGTHPNCNCEGDLFYQKEGNLFKGNEVYVNDIFDDYKTVQNKSEKGCEKEILETGKQECCIENDYGILTEKSGIFKLFNGNNTVTYDSGCGDITDFSLQRWFEDYEDSSKVCFAYNCDGEGRATILDPITGDYETIKVADNVDKITWENQ